MQPAADRHNPYTTFAAEFSWHRALLAVFPTKSTHAALVDGVCTHWVGFSTACFLLTRPPQPEDADGGRLGIAQNSFAFGPSTIYYEFLDVKPGDAGKIDAMARKVLEVAKLKANANGVSRDHDTPAVVVATGGQYDDYWLRRFLEAGILQPAAEMYCIAFENETIVPMQELTKDDLMVSCPDLRATVGCGAVPPLLRSSGDVVPLQQSESACPAEMPSPWLMAYVVCCVVATTVTTVEAIF